MKIPFMAMALVIGALAPLATQAQAPAGATGECKDGTFSTAEHKSGACGHHGGVKLWFPEKKAAIPVSKAPVQPAPAPAAIPDAIAVAPAPAPVPAPAPTAAAATGKVWVNKTTHVYHCSTDKWYGKTKHGAYMSEAEAIAAGNHGDHKKTCSQRVASSK